MIMMVIENDNNDSDNNGDNDENSDNDDNNKIPVDSPHKGPIMLSFNVTFVESKNNSRVSGDLRRHVSHVTSLWCDSSYESISSYMSVCIQNCVRCNWLWCFGNTGIQSAVDSPHKISLILCLETFETTVNFLVLKHHHVLFRLYFHQNLKFTHKF